MHIAAAHNGTSFGHLLFIKLKRILLSPWIGNRASITPVICAPMRLQDTLGSKNTLHKRESIPSGQQLSVIQLSNYDNNTLKLSLQAAESIDPILIGRPHLGIKTVCLYVRAGSIMTTTSAIMDCSYILFVVQKSASIFRANEVAGEAKTIRLLKPLISIIVGIIFE